MPHRAVRLENNSLQPVHLAEHVCGNASAPKPRRERDSMSAARARVATQSRPNEGPWAARGCLCERSARPACELATAPTSKSARQSEDPSLLPSLHFQTSNSRCRSILTPSDDAKKALPQRDVKLHTHVRPIGKPERLPLTGYDMRFVAADIATPMGNGM